MPCASGMHHQSGIRKLMHEFTRAASMVQMYVGEEYVGHIRGRKVFFTQCVHYPGDGGRGSGIHERGLAILPNQVNRCQSLAQIVGINRADAVVVISDELCA